jgi:putative ATP-dependent endonuclease of the OLD family
MSIYIEKVRIQNFRSLHNVEVSLSPSTTLLVGANNSGKTSFLRALSIALNSDRKLISLEDLFIDQSGSQHDEKTIKIDVKIIPANESLQFDDQWSLVFGDNIKRDSLGREFFAFRTIINLNNHIKNALVQRFVIDTWEKNDINENDGISADLSTIPFYFIDAQRDLHEDIFSRTSHFGRLASQIEYDDNQRKELEEALATLNSDAIKQSPVLTHLKNSLEELNRTVQARGQGVEITPFPKKIRDLHKGVKVHFQDGASDSFSLEYHGMGTRSWAALLAFKANISWDAQEKSKENEAFFPILALEEPEAHLHPNAQRQVYKQLVEISSGQKIISTHSPYIAAQAKLEEIRHFRKETDKTEVNQLNIEPLSNEEKRNIQCEVMSTRGELLFAKVVVLFEGKTEEQILPIFAEKHWRISAFEKGIYFLGCGGSKNYAVFLKLLTTFNIIWFILSDYDNEIVKNDLKSALKHVGISDPEKSSKIIRLGRKIESYLIEEGYQPELKNALIEFTQPRYASEQHKSAKQSEVEEENQNIKKYDDLQLLKELEKNKAKLAPIYTRLIVETQEPNRQIPKKIKELFQSIDRELNIAISEGKPDDIPF